VVDRPGQGVLRAGGQGPAVWLAGVTALSRWSTAKKEALGSVTL
jgi:hypothetical protein